MPPSPPIAIDPHLGMLVITQAVPRYNLSIATYLPEDEEALDEFATRHLSTTTPTQRTIPNPNDDDETEWGIPVLVALVPEPDNDYDTDAIAVHAPPAHPNAPVGAKLGYMRSTHVYWHKEAIHGLAASTNLPVGAYCWLFTYLTHDEEDLDRDEIACTWTHGRLNLLLPPSETLTTYARDYLATAPTSPGAANPHGPDEVARWTRNSTTAPDLIPTRLHQANDTYHVLLTDNGARVGTYASDTHLLTLHDERARAHAYDLLDAHQIPTRRPPAPLEDLTGFADARIVTYTGPTRIRVTSHDTHPARNQQPTWQIRAHDPTIAATQTPVIGEYDHTTATLRYYTREHEQPLLTLLARHNLPVDHATWTLPSHDIRVHNAHSRTRTPAGVDTTTPLHLHPRHQGVLAPHLEDLLQITWTTTPPPIDPPASPPYWQHGPCLLCDRPGTGPADTPLCDPCHEHLRLGRVTDTGLDGPWNDASSAALQRLVAIEFHTIPSKSQLTLTPSCAPEHHVEALLLRMLIPRDTALVERPHHPGRTYAEWLAHAGLLDEPTRRGISVWSVAADGHVCRSLLERRIDDFMHHHGIIHDLEPHYPHHPQHNPTGASRADWLLTDGTYVEALGLMTTPAYAQKVERKRCLARALGLQLLTIEPHELGILEEKFAPWIAATSTPTPVHEGVQLPPRVPARAPRTPATRESIRATIARDTAVLATLDEGHTITETADRHALSTSTVRTIAAAGNRTRHLNYHDDQASDRVLRALSALELADAGLTYHQIAEHTNVATGTVKELLSLARFLTNPTATPQRLQLARTAHHHHWTKTTIPAATSRYKRAIRDARALHLYDPSVLADPPSPPH